MKNFQQTLLILLALGLCGLCVWQWTDQANERRAIIKRNQTIYKREKAIQGYTNSIAAGDKEIAAMQVRLTQLESSVQSNKDLLAGRERDLDAARRDSELYSNEVVQYQAAVTNLEKKLDSAYDGIARQNDAIKQLVAQRDDFIGKYTNSMNARNEVVAKYNELVERLNRMRTNAAAPSPQ